jgi:hypothetical protein
VVVHLEYMSIELQVLEKVSSVAIDNSCTCLALANSGHRLLTAGYWPPMKPMRAQQPLVGIACPMSIGLLRPSSTMTALMLSSGFYDSGLGSWVVGLTPAHSGVGASSTS